MHLSKQFFLTILHIEVLLLSAKTTNGSIFVFYYTSFRGVIFSLAKKKVLQTLWLPLVFFSSFSFFANFVVEENIFLQKSDHYAQFEKEDLFKAISGTL